jgi:hypothetical protein
VSLLPWTPEISREGGDAESGEEKGREEEEEVRVGDGGEGVQPLPAPTAQRREVIRSVAKKKGAKKKK